MQKLHVMFSRWLVVGFSVLAVTAVSTGAGAQQRKPRGVIELETIHITGRIQKPIAAIDVGRLQPKLTLGELRQPFIDRIGQAMFKEPF
jgi:hypothetical protein